MLVSATEMLQKAKAGHYAVGQFNINNLEWTKAILTVAEECKSPVILGVSEGAGKYMTGYKTVVGMVEGMSEEMNITVPVALHLDHGSKGNHAMSAKEAEKLIDELLTLDNPYHCPHGRPTIISMTRTELEKKFKRIV